MGEPDQAEAAHRPRRWGRTALVALFAVLLACSGWVGWRLWP